MNTVYTTFSFERLYKYYVSILNDNSTIVEVGCFTGNSMCCLANEIKNSNKKIKCYAVDTWEGSLNEPDMMNLDIVKNNKLYDVFIDNLKRSNLQDYVIPIRKASLEAVKDFDDQTIDILFIDADHSYEAVKSDIEAWYPKVKDGGIISGHDYNPYLPDFGGWPGVVKAVNEKFEDLIKQINILPQIPQLCHDCWIVQK